MLGFVRPPALSSHSSRRAVGFLKMTRVYVGNLGENASKRELEREFEYFGPLRDVWIARNPPGFAFIIYEDRRDAEDATRELDGKYICGNRVRVEMARGPTRGGRAARLGLTEKCYECGRVGHYARECTRKPGSRGGGRRSRSRSRSRSPRRRRKSRSRSRSRSRSPHSRSPRSPRRNTRAERRSHSRSRSASRSKSRSRSRSPVRDSKREESPREDERDREDDRGNGEEDNRD